MVKVEESIQDQSSTRSFSKQVALFKMNKNERTELEALLEWVKTFPQFQNIKSENEKENNNETNADISDLLDDEVIAGCIFDIALEIFSNGDDATMVTSFSSDMWDNIISLTTRSPRKSGRRLVQYPSNSAAWKDCSKTFWRHLALTNLLDGAVSHPNIELRKVYIHNIMKLVPETQRSLMSLVENNKRRMSNEKWKKRASTPSRRSSSDTTNTSVSTARSLRSKTSRNTSYVSLASLTKSIMRGPLSLKDSNAGATTTWTTPPASYFSPRQTTRSLNDSKLQELELQNEMLQRELSESRQKEEEINQQLEDSKATFKKEMIRVESNSLQREEETKTLYNSKLSALENDLQRMSLVCANTNLQRVEMADIQEEMKILMQTKTLLDDTTERLSIYKRKADQLERIKALLVEEEGAHAKSVEENIRLNRELQTLESTRFQVEDYKTRLSKTEVQLMDCQDDLMDKRQRIIELHEVKSILERTIRSQQEEIHALGHHIQQEQGAFECGESIRSELNPKIQKESRRIQDKLKQLKQNRQRDPEIVGNTPSPGILLKNLQTFELDDIKEDEVAEDSSDEESDTSEDEGHLDRSTEQQFADVLQSMIRSANDDDKTTVAESTSSFAQETLKRLVHLHNHELARVKNKNSKLKTKADKVSKLKNKVKASNRLCKHYKEQYMTTKITLERTQLDMKEVMMEFYQSVELFGKASRNDDDARDKLQRRKSF